ncbi:hypothetical protein BGZ99_010333 [Dissophora globulifera]|uniref:RRM domain-containing protein n=1 Tax=Dissophora globulifera TaxID=979702 RepID=A0A9P6UYG5_9FUNG|nr:hypothetical protein BGZ99_010333 [Dissophora globulifera]
MKQVHSVENFHPQQTKQIKRLNEREANLSTSASGSWHEQYKDSAHIFVGGLPYNLTEGDVICVLSQFGEIAGVNLVRDKETGKSKGFAFIKYVDQRSTVLAVDNMNGSKIGGRVIRVDHVQNYKVPKVFDADGNEIEPDEDTVNNAAPKPIEDDESDVSSSESEVDDAGIDLDDPMREYLLKQRRKGKKDGKSKKSSKRKSGDKDGGETKDERRARRELRKAAKKDKKDKKEKKDKKDKDGSDDGDQEDNRKKNSKDAVLDENKDKVEDKMDIGGIAGSIDNTKKDADQKEQEGSNAKDFGNR